MILCFSGLAAATGQSTPAIGQPFPIAAVPGNEEENPTVAHDSGRSRFLAVNENDAAMNATCMTAEGSTMAVYVVPASNGRNPDVVYSSGLDEYLIVWEEGYDIMGARVAGICWPGVGGIGSAFTISGDRPAWEEVPAVAYNSHDSHQDYLVVWEDGSPGSPPHRSVWARRVNSSTVSGSSFAITDTVGIWNYEPDVAYNLNHNEYLVVYTQDPSQGSNPNAQDIYGRRVHNAGGGGLLAEHAIDNTGMSQHQPSVAAYRLNYTSPFLVVYTDIAAGTGSVWGQLVAADGTPFGSFLALAADVTRDEVDPAIASSEALGGYTVVWSQLDGDYDVWARRVTSTGGLEPALNISVPDGIVIIGSNERAPAVAGGAPIALVVWHEAFLTGDRNVYGRFLGYRAHLPLVLRSP